VTRGSAPPAWLLHDNARTAIRFQRASRGQPQEWLADVLARINDHNIQNLDQLLPWNWKAVPAKLAA
jgi:transposase